jgi:Cys-tRNA(Pro) deacylase
MEKSHASITPAIRFLREKNIPFKEHQYRYEERGGTRVGAEELGMPEHVLIKTLVMQTDQRKVLMVLMHGDCEVSTKQLARFLGVKSVEPCDEKTAARHTGYVFGGTSPFGVRTPLPVYVEKSIFSLPAILINGGKRGFLVEIDPKHLHDALPATEVEVAIPSNRTNFTES